MRNRKRNLNICSFLNYQMDVGHQSIWRKSRVEGDMDRANECIQRRCRRQRVKVVEVVANVDEGKWVDNEVEGGEEEKRDGA